jgi:hypothetical protein
MSGPWILIGGSILSVVAVVFLICLVYLAARGVRSLRRSKRCQHFHEIAAKKFREGDIPAAVPLFLKADAAWSLNTWDGSRDSWLKDLDRLASIGSGLVKTQAREPGTAYSDFNATIREMREMLRNRENFGLDGRRLLPDVRVRWDASVERLNAARVRLREVCNLRNVARR